MKIICSLVIVSFVGVVLARHIHIPAKSRNDGLFSEDEFTFPAEDNKKPSTFTGDVMKSHIVMQEIKKGKKGGFKYAIETENGIEIEQIGKLKNNKTFVVMGSYTYTGANGKRYRVRYTADELGYHPITTLDIEIPDPETGVMMKKPMQPYTFAPFTRAETTPRTTTVPTTRSTTTAKITQISSLNNQNNPTTPNNGYLPPSTPAPTYLPPGNTYLPPIEPNKDILPPIQQVENNYLPPF